MDNNSATSSHSDNEEFQNKEETAQQWVYRHLVEFTNCDDMSAKNLVDGDCSPLIQLLTDITQTKTLFITVTKPISADFPTVTVEPTVSQDPQPVPKKKSTKKTTKHRALKKKAKKGSKKKKKSKKKEKEQPTVVDLPPTILTSPVDIIFEWWTATDLPPHEQFIFFIPKINAPNADVGLDELYHVGYMKNRRVLKNALLCLDNVFYNQLSFPMKVDLLLLINEIEDSKIPREWLLEKFVIENIARNFNVNGRIRNIDSDARSITLILSQTVQTFCFQPDISERAKLLIQLSFFDIEFLGSFPEITVMAARLERALSHISILHFLFKNEACEWNRKNYLYLLDLFSTILAHEITKKSSYMTNYCPGMKTGPICSNFKKFVQQLVSVSREIFESQEDWSATNKVSFSFYIVGVLEEEIDSIIKKVEEMSSEARDMSLDRSAIQATKVILSELDAYLQEKCLESAVESGNLESLRNLASTIVKHNKQLERVVALY